MKINHLFRLSVISCILVILYQCFRWYVVEWITPFFMPILWLVVFGFFFVITILTIIRVFRKKDWKPLFIQALTLLLVLYFPFNQIVLEIDFKMNKSERVEVVKMVENGTIQPNASHDSSLIHLPEKYDQLSKGGGDIIASESGNRFSVFFFTYRGILDNFSGFLYSPSDKKPNPRILGRDFKEIEKLDDHWYFVGFY